MYARFSFSRKYTFHFLLVLGELAPGFSRQEQVYGGEGFLLRLSSNSFLLPACYPAVFLNSWCLHFLGPHVALWRELAPHACPLAPSSKSSGLLFSSLSHLLFLYLLCLHRFSSVNMDLLGFEDRACVYFIFCSVSGNFGENGTGTSLLHHPERRT